MGGGGQIEKEGFGRLAAEISETHPRALTAVTARKSGRYFPSAFAYWT